MSDSANNNPPKGDFEKAEKYINQLVLLLNQNKIDVFHTDLKKFDPGVLQDHYVISLKDYQIEISHRKQPNSGKDSYVMIFNNLKNISAGSSGKVILAYTFLVDSQFSKFKMVADRQIEDRRKAEEVKRFNDAVDPIDQLLERAAGNEPTLEAKENTPVAESKPSENSTDSFKSVSSQAPLIDTPQIHQI